MRLIDADALIEFIDNKFEVSWKRDYEGGFKDACVEILNAINDAPTIDIDRPQGEWEIVGKNHPYKRCPFCKRVRAFTDTRFCDWCGARMKGADDERSR